MKYQNRFLLTTMIILGSISESRGAIELIRQHGYLKEYMKGNVNLGNNCSGSLISTLSVLTSFSCVEAGLSSYSSALIGQLAHDSYLERKRIVGWSRIDESRDLAVLFLETKVTSAPTFDLEPLTEASLDMIEKDYYPFTEGQDDARYCVSGYPNYVSDLHAACARLDSSNIVYRDWKGPFTFSVETSPTMRGSALRHGNNIFAVTITGETTLQSQAEPITTEAYDEIVDRVIRYHRTGYFD